LNLDTQITYPTEPINAKSGISHQTKAESGRFSSVARLIRSGLMEVAPQRTPARFEKSISAITEGYGMGILLRRARLEEVICHITLGD